MTGTRIALLMIVAVVLAALAMSSRASAHGMTGPWPVPNEMSVDSWWYGGYSVGASMDEPYTPGVGPACSDPGGDWMLSDTFWYSFIGTGDPVVVRLDATNGFGMVLYQADDVPLADAAFVCLVDRPARWWFQTVAQRRYVIQIGDPDPTDARGGFEGYRLSVARAAPNDQPEDALPLPFDEPVPVSNFDAASFDELSECSTPWGIVHGTRGVWMRVDVPSPGRLLLDLQQRDPEGLGGGQLGLYTASGTFPIACGTGQLPPATTGTQIAADVDAGPHLVQILSGGEAEEFWTIRAHFEPDLDVDDDGHLRPSDCDDRTPAIHPGALDVPDDGIDQSCDGHDAHADTDGDGAPNVADRCPLAATQGIDRDGDGCRDPQQLALSVQLQLSLRRGRLRVARLTIASVAGAHIAVVCARDRACRRGETTLRRARGQLKGIFRSPVPVPASITVSASKAGTIGIVKRYRLTRAGLELRRTWCTAPAQPSARIACG